MVRWHGFTFWFYHSLLHKSHSFTEITGDYREVSDDGFFQEFLNSIDRCGTDGTLKLPFLFPREWRLGILKREEHYWEVNSIITLNSKPEILNARMYKAESHPTKYDWLSASAEYFNHIHHLQSNTDYKGLQGTPLK